MKQGKAQEEKTGTNTTEIGGRGARGSQQKLSQRDKGCAEMETVKQKKHEKKRRR